MTEVNFRGPLPVKERRWEKQRRVMRERRQASAFMKFRMDVIAETYSVHMKDMFLTVAYKEFLKNCGKDLERMRSRQQLQTQQLSAYAGDHYLKVDSHGSLEDVLKDSPKKVPHHFYRTTKLASWRVFRHHHNKYGHQPAPASYRRVSFIRPLRKEDEMCPYHEYLQMISDMMVRTKAEEQKLQGRTRAGSLLMLTPFEHHKFKADLKSNLLQSLPDTTQGIRCIDVPAVKRVAEKLTEQKLKEQEQTGKKVLFKGKGLPAEPKSGQSSRKFSRSSKRSSRATSINTGSEDQTEKDLTADSENETVASPESTAQSSETGTTQSEGEAPSVSSPQP